MKYTLLLKCMLLATLHAFSQTPVYYQFTPNNGLPSSETYEVVTDKEGYLWLGTDRGVARFDGKTFKLYTVNEGLGDNVVDRIFVSPGGAIWARCLDNNLYVLQKHLDRFNLYPLSKLLKSKLLGVDYVTGIYFQNEQPLYFGTTWSGLLKVVGNTISPASLNDSVNHTLNYRTDINLAFYNNIVGSGNRDFVFEGILYRNPSLNIKPLLIKRKNGDYIVSCNHWVYVIRNKKVLNAALFDAPITNIYEDNKENLWICFFMSGIKKIAKHEAISRYSGRSYFDNYLITSMVQDFEGGYWFTSYADGVFYIPDLDIELITFPAFPSHEYPKEITGNGTNKIFVATTDKRIAILENDILKEIRSVPQDSISRRATTSVCNDLFYDAVTHNILIAYSHGIRLLNEYDKSVFKTIKGSRAITRAGDKLYAVNSNALFNDAADLTQKLIPADNKSYYSFYTVFANGDGVLIGSNSGLLKYSAKGLHPVFSEEINLRVNSIKQLENGALVIATLGKGIFLIEKKKVSHIPLGNTAQQNMVNDLAVDGNIAWAATERGVVQIDLNDTQYPQFKSWSVANGFPYNDVRRVHIQQHMVYVIAQNQLIRINVDGVSENMTPPRVFLNNILISDHIALAADSAYSFDYQNRRVKFQFNGIAFKSGEHLRYEYRLKGFDDKWQIITQPFVEFPSLPYGKYTFELVSLNENNIASLVPVIYSFTIPPPFWKSWWFFIAGTVVIFGIMWLIVKDRFRRERQRNRDREALLQYEQQALSAQINPHFIFNALNSIQNFILQEDKRNAIKYLGRFSKLMRLNLDNARQKWIPPHQEFELIETYLELEKLRHKDRFTCKVHISDDPILEQLLVPSMLIQPFVENAILHGVNNLTNDAGLVEIDLQYMNGKLICRIEDNGVGREKAEELKHAHKRTHKGSGLTITRERLHLLCTETHTDFLLDVIDKKNEAGIPSGTIVVFNLPYKQNEY